MTVAAWIVAGVLVWAAVLAAVATRVGALERPVRASLTPLVIVVAVLVVADLGQVVGAGTADRPDSMVTHLGYAVASVGLVPMLTARPTAGDEPDADAEPVSLWVVAVALLAAAICVVRLVQTR